MGQFLEPTVKPGAYLILRQTDPKSNQAVHSPVLIAASNCWFCDHRTKGNAEAKTFFNSVEKHKRWQTVQLGGTIKDNVQFSLVHLALQKKKKKKRRFYVHLLNQMRRRAHAILLLSTQNGYKAMPPPV